MRDGGPDRALIDTGASHTHIKGVLGMTMFAMEQRLLLLVLSPNMITTDARGKGKEKWMLLGVIMGVSVPKGSQGYLKQDTSNVVKVLSMRDRSSLIYTGQQPSCKHAGKLVSSRNAIVLTNLSCYSCSVHLLPL